MEGWRFYGKSVEWRQLIERLALKVEVGWMEIRVSHNTPFFELSYALLTSHAIGLEEATKKISAL